MKPTELWGTYPLPGEQPRCWDFRVMQMWCKSVAGELWIAYQRCDGNTEALPEDAQPPQDIAWNRWALKSTDQQILLRPAFPNLPVVVKPEAPFRVTPQVRAKIYVRVPLWVQVVMNGAVLAEIPALVLSKTWFGDFVGGELCYWISSAARRQMEPDPRRPFLSICPVRIVNDSKDELLVEKICLRVGKLYLYLSKGQIWASETKVKYHGQEQGSEIEVAAKAPPEAPKAPLAAAPRETTPRGFTAKTFASLLDLPGFGFLNR